jgi:hypothetical protein
VAAVDQGGGSDGPATVARVSFRLPPGFLPLSLDRDPAVRRARVADLVRELFPSAPDEVLAVARAHYAAVADLQVGHGLAGAALRYGWVEGRITAAYVSFALTPLDYESVEVAAMGIFDSLTVPDELPEPDVPEDVPETDASHLAAAAAPPADGPGVHRGGRYVMGLTLPCGPAVAFTALTTVRVDAEESPSGQPASLDIGVLQVQVPVKEHQCLFVMTLTTPTVADFDEYCQAGAAIAVSLRFDEPQDGGDAGGWRPRGLIGTGTLGLT